jgi:transcriptional regulator with XRE-family HTH domain
VVDAGAERVGARVKRERGRRWRTQEDFAAAIGYRRRVVAALESGERSNFSEDFLGAVEAALGWEVGGIERIRRGEEPNRSYPPGLVRVIDAWPDLPENYRRLIDGVIDTWREAGD